MAALRKQELEPNCAFLKLPVTPADEPHACHGDTENMRWHKQNVFMTSFHLCPEEDQSILVEPSARFSSRFLVDIQEPFTVFGSVA